MFKPSWIFLAVLVSSSSFAGVSFKQKQMRVQSLMKLKLHAPAIAFEGYQRELEYEKQNLTIQNRAKNETNLMADKIRQQVRVAYEAAIKEDKTPSEAKEEIKIAIESDLALAAPEMREELLNLALEVLSHIDQSPVSEEVDLSTVEVVMMRKVESRQAFLNAEQEPTPGANPINPKANTSKDSEKKDYASRAELMESLVSDRESSRWVSSANQTVRTAEVVKVESSISLQIKVEFLGATLEAGPTISFKREYSTNAVIMAEGLNPVILRDGNFDLWKRDRDNNIIIKNGKQQKRYVAFFCDADMKFETDYTGGGGFKYLGLGADTTVSKRFENTVNLQSRRISLPESVANKTMTVKYISELCHSDFKKARFSNTMTVGQSLDIMMKNVVSGLIFSHPKTKCVQDSHCADWFYGEVIALHRNKNTYRCVENSVDKMRFCQLRGLAGQNCIVMENGKRTSSGEWEYNCNPGLRCVKYESATYLFDWTWSYAKGKCQK
ncbi:MAG: hypothetical protein H0V66_03115 [Bdellovibrionales bacterium]|nr:hypothetical protein [Bdellovibrionales bacterium]